jgi:hypothetical protein
MWHRSAHVKLSAATRYKVRILGGIGGRRSAANFVARRALISRAQANSWATTLLARPPCADTGAQFECRNTAQEFARRTIQDRIDFMSALCRRNRFERVAPSAVSQLFEVRYAFRKSQTGSRVKTMRFATSRNPRQAGTRQSNSNR